MCTRNTKQKTKIIVFKNNKNFLKDFLKHFKIKKKINVSLTCGKSWPKKYKLLKNFQKWSQNYFFLTDERHVSYHSKNSNYNKLKNYFKKKNLQNILLSTNPKKNLYHFNKLIKKPDVNLISIGEDGHIFSWFKEDIKHIKNSKKKSFFVQKDDFLRYTITPKIFKKKTKNIVLFDRISKTEIFENIFLRKKNFLYPIDLISINEIYISYKFFKKIIEKSKKYKNLLKDRYILHI